MREDKEEAKAYILRLLSYRQRSCEELIMRLKKKGFREELAREVCLHLLELGYIDERKLVRDWITDGFKFKYKGPRLLSLELKKRGLPVKIIEEGLENDYPREERLRACYRVAKKWLKQNKTGEGQEHNLKLKKYLWNRGFYNETITEVIKKIEENS